VLSARPLARAAGVLLAIMLVPRMAHAQVPAPQPPGPYVIDVRGTTLGVPQTSDFYPDIPGETVIPTRGFGVHAGAHIYPLPVRNWRIGFGVDVFLARATSTTPVIASANDDGTTTVVDIFPEVDVTQRIITPQVSLNFGTSRGWSYLSSGAGSARIRTTAGSDTLTISKLAVNVGGGARWFVTSHLGVGFDLRANWIGSRALFAASAGFSLK
jgi:hypothetical protein